MRFDQRRHHLISIAVEPKTDVAGQVDEVPPCRNGQDGREQSKGFFQCGPQGGIPSVGEKKIQVDRKVVTQLQGKRRTACQIELRTDFTLAKSAQNAAHFECDRLPE